MQKSANSLLGILQVFNNMLENSEEEVSNFFAIFVIAGGDPFSLSFAMHFFIFCSHNSPKIKRKKTISTVDYSIKTIHKSFMQLYVLNCYARYQI